MIMALKLQYDFNHLFFLLLGIVSVYAGSDIPGTALPNCQDRCGNVTIPYPFGIGSDCYKNEWFSVTCNTSFLPPKLFLNQSTAEVMDIQPGTLRINHKRSSYNCPVSHELPSTNLGDNPYLSYSEKGNRLFALGCGVQARILENNKTIGGCTSVCDDESLSSTTIRGDSCSGISCCQSMIPHGLKNFTLSVTGSDPGLSYATCKYAFLVDKDWLGNTSFSNTLIGTPEAVPVVLDWKFSATESCKICGPNSFCSKKNQYLSCSCVDGFSGNPYHPRGCEDIDECAKPNLNRCVKNCINAPGNYICSCPSGYHGDGIIDGTGCVENKPWVIPTLIGIGSGFGLLFINLGALWSYKGFQRRKTIKLKEKFFKRNGGLLFQQKLSSTEGSVEKTKLFTSAELEIATDKYNENRIVGRGGQGTIYKGMLTDGRLAAIKVSKAIDEGQIEQFINEVVILSQIDHRNVVKLLGCCLETEVPVLVYEFLPNGNLSHVIHDQKEEFPMPWEIRLRVATEVASAISYLHSAASVPIYHRDIKSSNILLDEKFRAKLSDFGTSKSIAFDQTHLTTQVKGTFGYFDPEYFLSSRFTEKSDVYSFGVVLVELLTGQKPIISSVGPGEKIGLAAYFISSLEKNHLTSILDAQVSKEERIEELMKVAVLAKRCLDLTGRNRPSMREVAVELEGIMISKGYSFAPKKQPEIDIKKSTENWDFDSTSSETYSEIITPALSEEVPLVFNTV